MKEPSLHDVSQAVVRLLREEEIATLATIDDDGSPSASTMHIASDGFSVYMHTFTYNLRRLQRILFYRELDFDLATMLTDPDDDQLRRQRVCSPTGSLDTRRWSRPSIGS